MEAYDVSNAIAKIENELIASMVRNLKHHKLQEQAEGMEWSMWQVEQLKSLEMYKQVNAKKYGKQFKDINSTIDEMIRQFYQEGQLDQEAAILKEIRNGFKASKVPGEISGQFFKLNDRKLEALIQETTTSMQKAETAILRTANDKYRKVIFNAQTYANSGAGTYEKAVDMATNDYLNSGLNCIEYKNGRRVTASAYSDMAIRTANKRAYLQGEGNKRAQWGVHTVIMNHRGTACPKCFQFSSKIFIDDVWSGGTSSDGPYPLLSSAIAQGLYHPNCKDSHTTYFPGVSEPPKQVSTEEKEEAIDEYNRQQKVNYYKHQEDACRRKAEYSLDNDKKKVYKKRADAWKGKQKLLHNEHESGDVYKYRIGNNVINNETLKRVEYSRKFSRITDNTAVNDSIRKYSKAILTHRNGSDAEDLYIISSKTGNLLFSKTIGSNELGVDLSQDEISFIKELSKKEGIIGIHNHPTNILPTGGDYASSGYRGYEFGVVVTHDANVYTYRHGGKPFIGKMLDKRVDNIISKDYNKNIITAQKIVLEQFRKEFGVEWKKL